MRGGAGLNVYITDRWGVTAGVSYVLPVGNLDNLRYVAVDAGFEFRF